jgi:photosystem II stability/assembly factor-like uncharacterized protein
LRILDLLSRLCIGAIPWIIIACLLYVGLFVNPEPVGKTVLPKSIEARDRFYGLVTVNSVFWAVGADGKIVRSEDSGANWSTQLPPVFTHFQDIAAWDENIAVVVGNEGVILHTIDGGKIWQQSDAPLNDVVNKLLDVKAYSNGEAWAVGAFGTLLFSSDYGKSWSYAKEPEDFIINEIVKRDDGGLVAVGEFGTILISESNGSDWAFIKAPVETSLMAVDFNNAGIGVAAGLEGVILKTYDGGFSWARVGNSLVGREGDRNKEVPVFGDGRNVTSEHILSIRWHAELNLWFGVGTKGLWLEAEPTAAVWHSGRLTTKEFAWHTSISKLQDGIVLGGKNIGHWSKEHQWTIFQ